MKVLWIVNIPLKEICSKYNIKGIYGGGWMQSLLEELVKEKNIELYVATPFDTDSIINEKINGVSYLLVPGGEKSKHKFCKRYDKSWEKVINDINPDVIHAHGSEYTHILNVINMKRNVPIIISIQGLIHEYAKEYCAGLSVKDIMLNYTVKDFLRKTGIYHGKKEMIKRGQLERKVLSKADVIIGRTEWDRAHAFEVNNKIIYKKNNENLRDVFYSNEKWNINNIEKQTIFFSQATYPIKGLHKLLEALYILKKANIECKVRVAGSDIYGDIKKIGIRDSGYSKYIKKLILKYRLTDSIEFLGPLDENGVKKELLNTNVFVTSSSIENSPNSLGEAMILGVPSVASYVGGIPSIADKEECLFYPFSDSSMLAYSIFKVLNDNNLANYLSENAKKRAEITHNREENIFRLIEIYKEVLNIKEI